jgi:hypothetical protein
MPFEAGKTATAQYRRRFALRSQFFLLIPASNHASDHRRRFSEVFWTLGSVAKLLRE